MQGWVLLMGSRLGLWSEQIVEQDSIVNVSVVFPAA